MSRSSYRNQWFHLLLHVLLQPIYWTAYVFQRVFGDRAERRGRVWEKRLDYRLFFQGAPTLIGLTLIGITAALGWRETFRAEAAYADAARTAFEEHDFTRASLLYGRLMQMQPGLEHYRYNLGLTSEKLDDKARAKVLIEPLAPRDRLGYAPAHMWIVGHILNEQPRPSEEHLQEAESHLLCLRRESVGLADQADEALAKIYAIQGRDEEIFQNPRLSAAAKRRPDLRLLLARNAVQRGRIQEAEETARELVPIFRRQVEDVPGDELSRRQLCEGYALLRDEAALIAALRQGTTLNPDGPFGEQWAEAAVVRALRIGNSPTATKFEKEKARREAIQLLDRYSRQSPRSQLLAGKLARLAGDIADAERRYLTLVENQPQVRIELADLYWQSQRQDDARRQWEEFLTSCRRTLDQAGRLAEADRLLAASSARRLERFVEAERWLIETAQTAEVKAALTQLYVVWWDSLSTEQRDERHFDLLRKGLRVDSGNAPLLARLLTAQASGEDATQDSSRTVLAEMIATGELPASAYLLLGTAAFERGDRENAQRYLEQARRLDPHSPVVLNNLSWTLFAAEKPNLSAALAAADAAVQLSPDDPHFRDTRFRILAKLGRWEQALEDLEKCASTMTGKPEFHRTAAEVYEHLKFTELAAEHRRLAGDR